ncbi:MAG: RsmE family RNA methyltransferase [Treponema sp.]|nr:RsmE family RNA methyltransferase [Treponema sp.]
MNLILFEEQEIGKALNRRDERSIHLTKVLRKKTGDTFDAGILGGGSGTGAIEKIGADGSLEFSLEIHCPALPRLPIRIAVGFPRPIQIRRLLRDLSSLGVAAIDLFGTELGEKSYRDTKLLIDGGARSALIEGAAQSRDTTIPALNVYADLHNWLHKHPWETDANEGGAVSMPDSCSEASGFRPPSASKPQAAFPLPPPILIAADNVRAGGAMSGMAQTSGPVTLAIGSERGWSDREREMLEAAGFLRLSLGSRALRTETACVAAAVLAIEKIGGLG